MKFIEALDVIGGFGKYQKIQFTLVCIPAAVVALHQLASVFLAATPEYNCDLVGLGQDNTSLPYIAAGGDDGECKYHSVPGDNSSKLVDCHHFIYSQENFYSTIVTEWDLVCSKKFYSTLSTMLYMAGKLAGALIFGILSDIIGRKNAMLLAMLLLGCVGLGAAFSTDLIMFSVLRFFVGAIVTGMYMCLFVLGVELIGKTYRVLAGVVICYFFALGYVILAGIAYLSRNWFYTQIIISAPAFLFLTYYWFVPESARWLLSRNRISEAEAILRKAARVNGVVLPDSLKLEEENTVGSISLRHLFAARRLLCNTIIIFINWFAVAMGYYGMSLSSGNLPGNIYLVFMLSGAIEFVAYTACLPINKLGRKGPHVFGMLVAGLACAGTIAIDLSSISTDNSDSELMNTLLIVMNTVGKFGMTMGFCIIYVWSAEIFPTTLRTSLMGLSSMCGRIGQILAPFIADIGNFVPKEYTRVVQSAIFGSMVIIGGLMSLYLPETAGRDMPETIADTEQGDHRRPDESLKETEFEVQDKVSEKPWSE